MTSVLLRHEFLRTRSALTVAVAVAVATTAVAALLRLTGSGVLSTLGLLLAALAGPGLVTAVDALLAVDYWRTSYGRQGYFTHTLPVRPGTIFAVRLGYSLAVVTLVTLLAGLLWVAAMAVGPGGESMVGRLRDLAAANPGVAALALLGIVASSWFYLVQLYFSASVGSEGRLGGMGVGGPVLVWFVTYLVLQLLAAVALFALPWGLHLVDGALEVRRYSLQLGVDDQDTGFPVGVLAVTLPVLAAMVARTAHSWRRRVSLR